MTPHADAAIEIVDYDTSWPRLFEVERTLLEQALTPWLTARIEHIGSTAVPGMAAKPVIDIMVPVESLAASRDCIPLLEGIGYLHAPYRAEMMHWFCKPSPALRTHHLNLVPYESPLWRQRILFRNCLRVNPAVARDYAELKWRLAALHTKDREAYTAGKGPFITQILERIEGTNARSG